MYHQSFKKVRTYPRKYTNKILRFLWRKTKERDECAELNVGFENDTQIVLLQRREGRY